MDQNAFAVLGRLLYSRSIAALGTNHDGFPFVSMVLTVADPDGSAFYILASRLAWHTKDFLNDPRVSLMLTEEEDPDKDPQTLARMSIIGNISVLEPDDAAYDSARALYVGAFPSSETTFELGDFSLYRITPTGGRFVGGFARAITISPEDLRRAARLQ